MTPRRVLAIGLAVAIAAIVAVLWYFGYLRLSSIGKILKLPWNGGGNNSTVVLKPCGLCAPTIKPGITYKVVAPNYAVNPWSSLNIIKCGFRLWLNISKIIIKDGVVVSGFTLSGGHMYLDIYRTGRYYIVFVPYNKTTYRLSLLINDTYNCTLMLDAYPKLHIKVVRCDLPYRLLPPDPWSADIKIAGTIYVAVTRHYDEPMFALSILGLASFRFEPYYNTPSCSANW